MTTRRAKRSASERDSLMLMVHGPEFRGGELLVLNPDAFPHVQITQPERAHPQLVIAVESLVPVRGKLQVSVAKDLAAQLGLEPFHPVTVRKVDPQDVTVDFVELSFKDQFLSRADVWRFKVTMVGQCVYVGRTVECLGIRSQVEVVLAGKIPRGCGVIGDATKIVVRSRSSRFFWLVQMSAEMWEFAPDGEIYYEKLLNRLLQVLIAKWSEASVSHSVTIIAFSRSFYDADQFPQGFDPRRAPFSEPHRQGFGPGCGLDMANGYGPTIHVDPLSGRLYEDFYKVLVMNFTGPDWSHLLLLLKKEFASYYKTHRWRTPEEFSPAQYELCRNPKATDAPAVPPEGAEEEDAGGASTQQQTDPTLFSPCEGEDVYVKWTKLPFGVPSRAIDGNILEAINVTLNVLDKHYMDRDLNRTGQSIVMMTAGCSIFNVSCKLAQITEQRMMDNGVGMDMISLSTPPLHVVPLFIFRNQLSAETATADHVFSRRLSSNLETSLPTLQQKHSFGEVFDPLVGGEAKSFDAGLLRGSAGTKAATQRPSSEGIQPIGGGRAPSLIQPPPNGSELSSSSAANEVVSYDVPHWVNITFLDFDCTCEWAGGLFTQPPSPLSSHGFETASKELGPREWHSCKCQVRHNQQFLPLPPFRMLDVSTPAEKLGFPVTLRKLMKGHPRDGSCPNLIAHNDIQSEDSGFCEPNATRVSSPLNEATLRVEAGGGSWNRLIPEMGELFSSVASTSPPDHLQISRSPDFEFIPVPTLVRHQSAGGYARAVLSEYDAVVFAPCVGQQEGALAAAVTRPSRTSADRTRGFSPLESHNEPAVASATIGDHGDSPVDWFIRQGKVDSSRAGRIRSSSKESAFASRESTSLIHSMLSPRNTKDFVGRQHWRQQSRSQKQATASAGVPIASRPTPNAADELSDSFLEAQLSHSVETDSPRRSLGSATRSTTSLPVQSLYGTPGKGGSFRPLTRSVTLSAALSENSPSTASEGLTGRSKDSQHQVGNPHSPTGMRRNQSEQFGASQLTAPLGGAQGLASRDTRKTAVNPFRYSSRATQSLSNDRRRWSHLFPVVSHGTTPHRSTSADFGRNSGAQDGEPVYRGPNWTSLTSPAVLPLTTDYFPAPKELHQRYTEAFYTLTLPTAMGQTATVGCVPSYRSHDELLIEMICQRLARDFQLVSSCDSTAALAGNASSAEDRQRVYHLSMGHRIHQLIYDAERQTIEVKRFVQREPRDPEAAHAMYNYSLWVELTQSFQPHQQLFHRYPQPEDNWNALDNLLCGYLDEMMDTTKCRRVRFAMVPPLIAHSFDEERDDGSGETTAAVTASAYAAKFNKFLEFLQSRVAPSEFGELETIAIDTVLLERAKAAAEVGGGPPPGGRRMLSFKMSCKSSASVVSASPFSKVEDSRAEWVVVRLEDTLEISRCFHLDVRWLACSGIAADEFVSTVRRRAKQAGVDLRRVPEYSSVSRVQIHPLVASVFLPLPPNAVESFVTTLTEELAFVLDDERIADGSGIGYGLGIDQEVSKPSKPRPRGERGRLRSPSTKERLMRERWRLRGYKQFLHRRLPVFVRVIQDGLVWVPSYDYDRRGDGTSGEAWNETSTFQQERLTPKRRSCGSAPMAARSRSYQRVPQAEVAPSAVAAGGAASLRHVDPSCSTFDDDASDDFDDGDESDAPEGQGLKKRTARSRRAALWSTRLHALLWVAAAGLVAFATDFVRVIFTDPRVKRGFFNVALICTGVNLCITAYLAIYLPYVKRIHLEWSVYCPRMIPAASAVGALATFCFICALWPVWGLLTPGLLALFFIGALMTAHFLPSI
ncbi:hypothetical protein BBJ28_00009584 [Nothophytophthora sp. Chile5]|nr:hypothetical protein BBJ28_00009584 [Nothophytophthora sp. Chile5]